MLEELRSIVGPDHVLTDPAVTAGFTTDWTGRFSGPALCVVRPADTDQVAAVMRLCHAHRIPVIPQGGNTGLVGGGVPGPASAAPLPVLLSTTRLNWISDVDQTSGQITCGAGATLGDVQAAVQTAGWIYGVDLAARESATIGGTVATNAGGIRVIAYGMTRRHIIGFEAVLADGTVIEHSNGLVKDNTGLDLGGLLCGSEGTLAVITAVCLSLMHKPRASTVAFIGLASVDDALGVMRAGVRGDHPLLAAEIISERGMRIFEEATGITSPLARDHPWYLLLEVADGATGDGYTFETDRDVVIGIDASERARLWRFREGQADAFATLGVVHKLDISAPLNELSALVAEVEQLLDQEPTVSEFGIFGHLGDGNMHVEFSGPSPDDERVDRLVLQIVSRHRGSISAEHGIGRHKAEFLHLSRSAAEIAAMRAIKEALDPQGILNPGVLLPDSV